MRRACLLNPLYKSRGATLTEMLVAVVILSTGMVTVADMLNESINSLAHSLHRQRAAQLSMNMAEVLSGLHADAAWSTPTPANHNCASTPCGPTELLQHSLYNWQQQIARQLPNGQGGFWFKTYHGQPVIEIQIAWLMRGGNPASFVARIPVTPAAETL